MRREMPDSPAPPPESNPDHPASWLAGAVNALLEKGVLFVSGGRVTLDPNPIEHGQIFDRK